MDGRLTVVATILLSLWVPNNSHPLLSDIVDQTDLGTELAETLFETLEFQTLNILPFVTTNFSMLPSKLFTSIKNHPLIIVTNTSLQNQGLENVFLPRPKIIIVEFSSTNKLFRILANFRKFNLWTSNAVFIVMHTNNNFTETHIKYIQQILNSYGIFRAVGIGMVDKGPVKVILYSPDRRPFRGPRLVPSGFNINMVGPANVSGHALGVAVYTFTKYEKLACRKGELHKVTGRNVLAALIMASALKVKPLCFTRQRYVAGRYFPNGSYTGLLEGLYTGRVEILFYPTIPDLTDFQWRKDFVELYPHLSENYCFYVRKSDTMPFLKGAAQQLSIGAWLLLGAILGGLSVLGVVSGERNILYSVITTTRTFVTGTFSANRHGYYPLLGLGTSIFGVVMLNAFQSFFTSILAAPKYEEDLSTLEEVDRNVKYVHTYSYAAGTLINMADGNYDVVERLAAKLEPSNKPDSWIEFLPDLISRGGRALLLFDSKAEFFVKQPIAIRDGRRLLHRVAECMLSTYPVGYAARRVSPYAQIINTLTQRINEGGIFTHLDTKAELRMRKLHGLEKLPLTAPLLEPYALGLGNLVSGFKILGCGLTMAMLVFVCEYLFWVYGEVMKKRILKRCMKDKSCVVVRVKN